MTALTHSLTAVTLFSRYGHLCGICTFYYRHVQYAPFPQRFFTFCFCAFSLRRLLFVPLDDHSVPLSTRRTRCNECIPALFPDQPVRCSRQQPHSCCTERMSQCEWLAPRLEFDNGNG